MGATAAAGSVVPSINPRRQAFERQRQRMIAHAKQQQYQDSTDEEIGGSTSHQRQTLTSSLGKDWSDKAKRLLVAAIQSVVAALSSCTMGGPHDLPQNFSNNNPFSGDSSLGFWLLRLQIAYYSFGGRYGWSMWNSVLQRKEDRTGSTEEQLHSPPESNSVRVLGILILSQVAGEFARFLTRSYIEWAVRRSLQRQSPLRNSSKHTATTTSMKQSTTNLAMPANRTEAKVAAAVSASSSIFSVALSPRLAMNETAELCNQFSSALLVPCSICQEPRKYPACSMHCGHVFCWNCLHLWVASKSECLYVVHRVGLMIFYHWRTIILPSQKTDLIGGD
ncbi:hypothetical protein ACA910_021587 [Epithemia clementina (nom. ined.)]